MSEDLEWNCRVESHGAFNLVDAVLHIRDEHWADSWAETDTVMLFFFLENPNTMRLLELALRQVDADPLGGSSLSSPSD